MYMCLYLCSKFVAPRLSQPLPVLEILLLVLLVADGVERRSTASHHSS